MSSELLKHPFVTATRERALELADWEHLLTNLARGTAAQSENRARMDAADRYEVQVFRQTLGLTATIQVLADARRMISVFPAQLVRAGRGRDR